MAVGDLTVEFDPEDDDDVTTGDILEALKAIKADTNTLHSFRSPVVSTAVTETKGGTRGSFTVGRIFASSLRISSLIRAIRWVAIIL